jgi:hypothetical protein
MTRKEAFGAMENGLRFDLIVFGCGLSGIAVAREAALAGARVLVVEPAYPGSNAGAWRDSLLREVSRSPWSLLRSWGDLQRILTSFAPHLTKVRPYEGAGRRGFGSRLALRRLHTIARSIGSPEIATGIPDSDERTLIRELALAARQEGVFVMGATTAGFVERDVESGTFRIAVRDLLSDEQRVVGGGGIFVDPTFSQSLVSRIGTPITKLPRVVRPHLAVVCSVEGSRELDFVRDVELAGGGLGTVCQLCPGVVEVTLLDVNGGADSATVSSLVRQVCEASGSTFIREVSRRSVGSVYGGHIAVENRRGILIAHDGAPWRFLTVVQKTLTYIEGDETARRSRRPLPGEWRGGEREEFVEKARSAGVCADTIAAVIERWHGRVRYIPEMERGFEEVCSGVLRGEIALAVLSDQVSSLEELLFGSLALHTVPGWRELVAPIAAVLVETGAVPSEAAAIERAFAAMSAA